LSDSSNTGSVSLSTDGSSDTGLSFGDGSAVDSFVTSVSGPELEGGGSAVVSGPDSGPELGGGGSAVDSFVTSVSGPELDGGGSGPELDGGGSVLGIGGGNEDS